MYIIGFVLSMYTCCDSVCSYTHVYFVSIVVVVVIVVVFVIVYYIAFGVIRVRLTSYS